MPKNAVLFLSSKVGIEINHSTFLHLLQQQGEEKWLGLFEQLFPKDKWSHSWVDVLGKARQS